MTPDAPKRPTGPVPPPKQLQVQLDWSAANDLPMFYATSFAVSLLGPDEILLAIGQALPPLLTGTPEQIDKKAAQLKSIPVNPGAKLVLSTVHLQELIKSLLDAQELQATIKQNPSSGDSPIEPS